MNWNAAERALVAPLVDALRQDDGPRRIGRRRAVVRLSAEGAVGLADACPGPRSLIVRQLCTAMRFSESRLCQLRLEHKLVQALVLHHFCGDAMPVTRGVRRELSAMDARSARDHLERTCPRDHVFIKAALGNSSGERRSADAREQVLAALDADGDANANAEDGLKPPATLHDEAYVLQQRVEIDQEFRLHTVEDQIVPELTFRRYGTGISQAERERANIFGQEILDRLPNALVRGTVAAWDVAASRDGRFVIIETNLAGYHTVFEPGFHCSGYFLGPWAATSVAKLMDFVEQAYDTTIQIESSPDPATDIAEAYWRVARWLELYRIGRSVDVLGAAVSRHVIGPAVGPEKSRAEQTAFTALLSRLETVADSLRMT